MSIFSCSLPGKFFGPSLGRRRTVRAFLALCVLWSLPFAAAAQDQDLVRIGKGDWCPYVCEAALNDGNIGYAAEMLRIIYERAGYRVEFIPINYSMGIVMARTGKTAIMACMYPVDAPDLVFPQEPLGKSVNHFFVSRDNPWRFEGLKSLEGVTVGLVQDYKYPEFQEYIDANPEDFLFMSGADPLIRNLKMLGLGRIDAVFDDRNVVNYQLRALGMAEDIVDAGSFGMANTVLVGFSPRDARTPELVRILEQGIVSLRHSGELEQLLQKYEMTDWK